MRRKEKSHSSKRGPFPNNVRQFTVEKVGNEHKGGRSKKKARLPKLGLNPGSAATYENTNALSAPAHYYIRMATEGVGRVGYQILYGFCALGNGEREDPAV